MSPLESFYNILERLQKKRQTILDNYWFGWLHRERLDCLNDLIDEIQMIILDLQQPKKLNEGKSHAECTSY
jgi:hypothetical protein